MLADATTRLEKIDVIKRVYPDTKFSKLEDGMVNWWWKRAHEQLQSLFLVEPGGVTARNRAAKRRRKAKVVGEGRNSSSQDADGSKGRVPRTGPC